MAIALARRYRPRRFSDLLVQDHVAAVLRGAVQRDRVGHGYLLTGPRGVGKTTAARILAMALNCPRREPSGDPCGECDSCLRIWNGSANLDVVEIDAASNRGVDDARDLRERAMYAPSEESHYKVYIVDEAHMLTREAWNALLKILEEPPPRVVFVFATTEPQKIAATAAPVLSRLQRFDFRRIGPAAIRERLRAVLAEEGIAAEEDALTIIARHADGGMRDALSVLDQCLSFGDGAVTAARVRDTLGLAGDERFAEMLQVVVGRDPAGVFALVERLMDAGADLGEFMNGAAELLRALLMVQVGAEPEGLTEAMRALLRQYREELQPGDVLRMLRLLTDNETAIRRSANSRLVVETLLLRWAMLDRVVDLEQVLRSGSGPLGAPPAPAAPRPRASVSPAPVPEPERRTSERRGTPGPERGPGAAPASAEAAEGAASPSAVPFELDAIREAWPSLVAAVRAESRFLGEALAVTRPAAAAAPELRVSMAEPNPLLHERLEQQAATVERIVSARVGGPVRLRIAVDAPDESEREAPAARMSESGIRAARLKGLRERDPALDAAADELDLEIVE
ncbi:MAG TPA: DNA polymerase III subunit gamma/tau [Gemmatimonadales bacterium]|nr:DNA polymerase III subunit gamma/tau [Gemmatimonadales bacterium]